MEFTLFYIRIFLNWIVQDEINKNYKNILRTYPGSESIKNGFLSLFWVSLCATGRLYGKATRTDRLTWQINQPLYISHFVSQHIELHPLALSRQMCPKNYWLRSIYQRRYFKTCSPLQSKLWNRFSIDDIVDPF